MIVFETGYILFRRRGRDFSWFSLSALAYLTVLISVIWNQDRFKLAVHNVECHDEAANDDERIKLKTCVGVRHFYLDSLRFQQQF